MSLPTFRSPPTRTWVFVVIALGIVALVFYRNVVIWSLGLIRLPGPTVAVQGILKSDLGKGDITPLATGLVVPWSIGFLPDGSILVTERPGMLKRVAKDGRVLDVKGVGTVKAIGEGGLLGLAVHPHFDQNHWIYLYRTVEAAGGIRNRVDRFRLDDDTLSEQTTIVQGIPAAAEHDGGALAFGPDGDLYAATGDAGQSASAQDLSSLAGKILRVNDDGAVPADNPFGTAVWSYGHRNVEGLAFDAGGQLWATEHGRSGLQTGFDELNQISAGANYGWPTIQGDEEAAGMRKGFVHSGPTEPWAPAGAAFLGTSVFFGGLRGESLYQAKVNGNPVTVLAHFQGEFGRIRAVAAGPDHQVYFTTSNTDGRGFPRQGDDQLIRVNPSRFQ
jgi:glucose/arabinose dehydrogenase